MARSCDASRFVAVLGIGLGLGLAAAGCDPDVPSGEDDDVLAGVEVTLHEALAIGRAEEPGGIALEAELSLDDEPVYDIDLLVDGEIKEVFIDAKTGEVTANLSDPEDLEEGMAIAAALAGAAFSLDEAIDIAEDAGDGEPVAIDMDGAYTVFHVVVIRNNDAILVTVDLATGEPIVDDEPPEDD